MLYKGDSVYTDSAQIRDDLMSKKIQTFIVSDKSQEDAKREQGWVDLAAMMASKRPVLKLNKSDNAA